MWVNQINSNYYFTMVAHRCQSKKKNEDHKNEKKNNTKNEKKYYSEKNPTKLSSPMSAKWDT